MTVSMGVKVMPAQSVAWDRGDGCGGYGSMFSQRDFRCSVLWAFGDLATAGLAAPVGSGGIKHHISMFPGKQTTFLSPSHGITAVITAVICGAKCKGFEFCLLHFQSSLFCCFFPLFVPYLWLNNYQKYDEDIVCRKSSRCLFSQWLWGVCEQRLSQLLINETGDNVQSDLLGKKKKKKEGCANIRVAVWVNFCTSTCIYVHELLPYWLVLFYHSWLYQPS